MLKVLKKSVYNRVTFLSGNFNFVGRKAYSVNDNLINDLEPTKSFRLFERFTFCVLKFIANLLGLLLELLSLKQS